jgi:hypothetical protein
MKDRDGKPVKRDALFLQEMKLAEPRVAARIEACQAGAAGLSATLPCSSYASPCDPLQEAAVTIYSEAVASGEYGHSVHVSGGGGSDAGAVTQGGGGGGAHMVADVVCPCTTVT